MGNTQVFIKNVIFKVIFNMFEMFLCEVPFACNRSESVKPSYNLFFVVFWGSFVEKPPIFKVTGRGKGSMTGG